ncbi:MAG: hypothetical protein A4E35_01768 [Methanoregula sp. PtaU1.Bin051]|nr:MAG: hypothetical protein A4E35_01768 [Methanoregula sp. PtaU1.Bin051]
MRFIKGIRPVNMLACSKDIGPEYLKISDHYVNYLGPDRNRPIMVFQNKTQVQRCHMSSL